MIAKQAYDTPLTEIYESATGAFGATTATRSYIGPKGKRGLVRDIEVFLTADAVGTTAVPEIDVGTASGDVSYARYRLGSAAGSGLAAAATPQRARSLTAGNPTPPALNDYPGHVALETAFIPPDTAFVVTMKQGTGGTPAGTGTSRVTIDWF